jgi:hypothetical protein
MLNMRFHEEGELTSESCFMSKYWALVEARELDGISFSRVMPSLSSYTPKKRQQEKPNPKEYAMKAQNSHLFIRSLIPSKRSSGSSAFAATSLLIHPEQLASD